jgi:hypothetical protein
LQRSDPATKGATALMMDNRKTELKLPPQDLENQVLETIEISDADFALLAAARARQVKEFILQTGKVEANRLFLAENSSDDKTAKGSRVYLHLR